MSKNRFDAEGLLETLRLRFEKNMVRHKNIKWEQVRLKLDKNPEKLAILAEMERSGGEPDVVGDPSTGELVFYDCCSESPQGRRSLCYDKVAWSSRKEAKPKGSAMEMAEEMGIEMLSEVDYRNLQKAGEFDLKSSSWLLTPEEIRNLGGAIFGDRRYDQVFVYHNGAESYYAARGFRGKIKI